MQNNISERVTAMETLIGQHETQLKDHETRIRAGEKAMFKFIGALFAINIAVTIALHFWKI